MRNTARKDGGGAQGERSTLLTSKSCTMAPAGEEDMQQSDRRTEITTTSATITAPPTSAKVTSNGKGAWGKKGLDSRLGNSSGVYKIPRPP